MKDRKRLTKRFGKDEYGFALIPTKFSNVKISRFENVDKVGGCTYCFPHGIELTNSTYENLQKNWKRFRHKQFGINKVDWQYYRRKAGYQPFKNAGVTNDNFNELILDIE